MINAISSGTMDELIEKVEKEGQNLRNVLNDIVLYTEGAYNIKDLYIMPMYYINEIMGRIEKKNEKFQEELEKSKGQQITRF